MNDLIQEFVAAQWPKGAGANPVRIRETEAKLGFKFPEDYQAFLLWSDGGEGSIGELYLQVWSVEHLIENYQGYQFQEFFPGVLGLASDLGGSCVALDYRANSDSLPAIR